MIVGLSANSTAQIAEDNRSKQIFDLEYAVVNEQSLKLDLSLPKPTGDSPPLVVWIHGGGWRSGDKSKINPISHRLVLAGYAVAAINYRLGGLQQHPNHIHDCKGAVRWLRANAGKYGYDTTRIGVAGGSAGGHLALLLALSAEHPQLEGSVGGNLEYSSRVSAVVDMFGVADMVKFAVTDRQFKRKQPVEFFRSASPIEYISNDDPPLLIFHGDKDAIVPLEQSQILHHAYQQAGLESSLYIVNGGEHGGPLFNDRERFRLIKQFFDKYLRNTALSGQQSPPQTLSMPKASANKLAGFHWMIGPKNGLTGGDSQFEMLLRTVDHTLGNNSAITGLYIMTHWDLIEPIEKNQTWERLDKLTSLVKKHKRYFKLAVTAGAYTPEWVYRSGAKAFNTSGNNPNRKDSYKKPVTIPLPWDTVYRDRYFAMLTRLAEHYSNTAEFRAITLTVANFLSPEWHLPRTPADLKAWRDHDDYLEKIASSWRLGIDRFAQLFPEQFLVLEASSYPLGNRALGDSIVAHGAKHYPGRFAVQMNQLSGRFDMQKRETFAKMGRYKSTYGDAIQIGYQNLKGWSFPAITKQQGSMEMTAYNFVQGAGEYWEIWHGDALNQDNFTKLEGLKMKAERLGVDAYKRELKKQTPALLFRHLPKKPG